MKYVESRAQWEHTDEEERLHGWSRASTFDMPPSLRRQLEAVADERDHARSARIVAEAARKKMEAERDAALSRAEAAEEMARILENARDNAELDHVAAEKRLQQAEARVRELEAEVTRVKGLIDRDRTGLAAGLDEVRKRARAGFWISEGRGSYEWDDDRYRKETGVLVQDILAIVGKALTESGQRADEAFHPTDPAVRP